MRKMILALALSAGGLAFGGMAAADEMGDKLMAMCKSGDPKPETCDCQVKALTDNMDAKALQVMVASQEASKTGADATKAMTDALAAAGMTQADYDKAMADGMAKAEPAMEACKK